jgi:hypothetical protein
MRQPLSDENDDLTGDEDERKPARHPAGDLQRM